MAKTIAVADDVYEALSKARMKGESFSDVIRRLLSKQKISEIPKILDEKEADLIKEIVNRQKELEIAERRREL